MTSKCFVVVVHQANENFGQHAFVEASVLAWCFTSSGPPEHRLAQIQIYSSITTTDLWKACARVPCLL